MVDGDFQRLIGALAALLPAQLVVLDTAVRQQMARVKSQIASAPEAFAEPVAAAPARPPQSATPGTAPTIGAIEARFAQAPKCPACAATTSNAPSEIIVTAVKT